MSDWRAYAPETHERKLVRLAMAAGRLHAMPAWERELFDWAVAMEDGRQALIAIGGEAVLTVHTSTQETVCRTSANAKSETVRKRSRRRGRRRRTRQERVRSGRASSLRDVPSASPWADSTQPTEADREVMRDRYPQFYLAPQHPRTGLPFWRGTLWPFRKSLTDTYRVEVLYVRGGDPRVLVVDPPIDPASFPRHPHLYRDGAICSYHPDDGTWIWGRDDVSVVVDMAVGWLVQHICWKQFGLWPGPEVPH